MPKATFQKFIGFSLREKLSILFAQPIIMFLMPRTLFRLCKNVLKKEDDYVTGFSPHTAVILTYYMRIADLVEKYSKKGYFSDTALGFSAKERFWLNPISLFIFNKLKIRKFCIFTSCILFFNILLIGTIEQNSWVFLIILCIIPSSLFLLPFFRMAKPETFSWAFFPLAFYFFLKEYYFLSAIVVFLISFLNFTTSLLIIGSILVYGVLSVGFFTGVLVVFPASLKLLINVTPFLTSPFVKGLLEVLGGKKSKSRKDKFLAVRPNDLLLAFFYIIFALTFFSNISYTAYLLLALAIFFINQTLFRFADNHTFFRFLFVVSTVFVIIEFNPASFIAYLLLIYISSIGLFESVEDIVKEYPHLKPYSIKDVSLAVEEFFKKAEDQSRIAFEAENTEKDLAGFRGIFTHFEYVLSKREIGLLPGEYLRLTQMDYFMKEYIKLNDRSSKETIKEKLEELGAECLLVHSEDFAAKLRSWEYKELSKMSLKDIEKNYQGLNVPKKNLYLFKAPFRNSFIIPETPLIRRPNLIKFKAERGKTYIIKYNYHKAFKAFQNRNEVEVSKAEGKLSYLSLTAPDNGEVALWFQ